MSEANKFGKQWVTSLILQTHLWFSFPIYMVDVLFSQVWSVNDCFHWEKWVKSDWEIILGDGFSGRSTYLWFERT